MPRVFAFCGLLTLHLAGCRAAGVGCDAAPLGIVSCEVGASVSRARRVRGWSTVRGCAGRRAIAMRTVHAVGTVRAVSIRHGRSAGIELRDGRVGERRARRRSRFGRCSCRPRDDRVTAVAFSHAPADARRMSDGIERIRGKGITVVFEGRKCIHSRNCVLARPDVFVPNVQGEWIHPEVATPEEIVALAENCPSGAIRYEYDDGRTEPPAKVNVARVREDGPVAITGELVIAGVEARRATLCRCGASKAQALLRRLAHRGRVQSVGRACAEEGRSAAGARRAPRDHAREGRPAEGRGQPRGLHRHRTPGRAWHADVALSVWSVEGQTFLRRLAHEGGLRGRRRLTQLARRGRVVSRVLITCRSCRASRAHTSTRTARRMRSVALARVDAAPWCVDGMRDVRPCVLDGCLGSSRSAGSSRSPSRGVEPRVRAVTRLGWAS